MSAAAPRPSKPPALKSNAAAGRLMRYPAVHKPRSRPPSWPLLMLALLLPACESVPKRSPPVEMTAAPALPMNARQPPAPGWCLPTCSAALQRELQTWLPLPTPEGLRVKPARPPTAQ